MVTKSTQVDDSVFKSTDVAIVQCNLDVVNKWNISPQKNLREAAIDALHNLIPEASDSDLDFNPLDHSFESEQSV